MSDPLNMTDGEKMVWAAAFARALEAYRSRGVSRLTDDNEAALYACSRADNTLLALRFAGTGHGRAAVCELGAHSPTAKKVDFTLGPEAVEDQEIEDPTAEVYRDRVIVYDGGDVAFKVNAREALVLAYRLCQAVEKLRTK